MDISLQQLGLVHDQYCKMKVALRADADTPDTSLTIADPDWCANINKYVPVYADKEARLVHICSLNKSGFQLISFFF